MPDNSQRPSDRKLTLIAPLAILAVVGLMVLGALFLRPGPAESPPPPPPAITPPPPAVAPPVLPPPLTRAEILARVAAAASSAAAGAAPAAGAEPIISRPFRIRIPFGCEGPTASPAAQQAHVEFDAARQTVKLVARPAIWTDLPLIRQLPVAAEVEAVEGFWIPRPWTDSEACPPRREPAKAPPVAAEGQTAPKPAASSAPPAAETISPPPPPPETVGLARIFTAGGSRVVRRDGRPYSFVRKVPEGETPTPARGYRLVLEGRVTGYPDGRAVRCQGDSPDRRPVCLVAVEFDRVAFEDGETGAVLAEWRE